MIAPPAARSAALRRTRCRNCWRLIGTGEPVQTDPAGVVAFHPECPAIVTAFPPIGWEDPGPDHPYRRRR